MCRNMCLSVTFVLLCVINFTLAQTSSLQTSPTESSYEVRIWISSTCDQQVSVILLQRASLLCNGLSPLNYKDCVVRSDMCLTSPEVELYIDILLTFPTIKQISAVIMEVSNISELGGMTIKQIDVRDVNECNSNQHMCPDNAYCTNKEGTYECGCGFGFTDSLQSSVPGLECVVKCNIQSCRFFETCSEGTAENPEVICTCPSGYSGTECTVKEALLSHETVIALSVMVVLAALAGLVMCAYSAYRLFWKKSSSSDTVSESSSLSDYKPKSLPYDYTQFSDLGSFSRGSALNRGYTRTIQEESEPDSEIANNRMVYGARRLEARLDVNDAPQDPTPYLTPINRTDRHTYSVVEPQPDFF